MSVYRRDQYGTGVYGDRPRSLRPKVEYVVDPFLVTPRSFSDVELRWREPGGDWETFRLVHSRVGYPISENDGTTIFETSDPSTGEGFLHTGVEGGWHYYAVFLQEPNDGLWQRAAFGDTLVPFDYSSTDLLWDLMPEFYKQVSDSSAGFSQQKYRINPAIYQENLESAPNETLGKFLHVLGWTADLLRTQIELTLDGYDVNTMHVNRLALLAAQFGSEIENAVPASVNRMRVRNLGLLYRNRGTLEGVREAAALATGWNVDITTGPNLMLSEEQANLVNPAALEWDPNRRYITGERVRFGSYLYQAKVTTAGASQAPTGAATANTWWEHPALFLEPQPALPRYGTSITRTDTGDVSTWQAEGPGGFLPGRTFIATGVTDPEDLTVRYSNALAVTNTTTTNNATFKVRSVPRPIVDLTKWDTKLVYKSGIPVPRARKLWNATTRYRAGAAVLYQGGVYEALTTVEGTPPNDIGDGWQRLGFDDRIRLCLSWFSHGPFSGTAGSGGVLQNALITEFNSSGQMIKETICTPAVASDQVYDTFNVLGPLTGGRATAVGPAWSANNQGTWQVVRDNTGGYAYPPETGATFQLAPSMPNTKNIALTYRGLPTAIRLMGIVFRWTDASNYWIATQTGLYKVVGGVRSNPASGSLIYTKFQVNQRIRVNLNGNTIQVYRDDVLIGTATDSFNATATRHGIGATA